MKLFGAIDLHSNNNVMVLINARDEVVYRKRLANDLTSIIEQLSGYQPSLEGIVVESTYNWYWLVDGLWRKGTKCTWPTRRPSNNTMGSNTPTTIRTRAGWRICFGWESCPRVIFIRENNGRYAIYCASEAIVRQSTHKSVKHFRICIPATPGKR